MPHRSTRGVYSFEARELILPEEVTLDTSFVVDALFAREAHHASAKLFLTQLAEARSIIVFNQVLEYVFPDDGAAPAD